MCIDKILNENDRFLERVKELKEISPYYPELIYSEVETNSVSNRKKQCISTIVRIFRNEQWYGIHLVEEYHWNYFFQEGVNKSHALEKLIRSAYLIQHLYITVNDETDSLQITEIERLKELHNNHKI